MESDSARNAPRGGSIELDQLELMVRRLIESHEALRRRAAAAETRVQDLTRAVEDVSTGRLDPLALEQKANELEAENRALRARLDAAHDVVQRMLGRLHFAEEER